MTDNITIRCVEGEDLPNLLEWRNAPEIRRNMFKQEIVQPEEHQKWFQAASRDKTRHLFIISDNGTPLGFAQFNHNFVDNTADWGFYARPLSLAGTGNKIGNVALNYAFSKLDFHKICGQAIETNLASIKLHMKLGFEKEGVMRSQKRLNGKYYSLICFGLLRQEWNATLGKRGSKNEKN